MVPSWLLDLQPDGAELRMYCTLARFGRFDTATGIYEECRPAMSTAAEKAGMSLAHAKRAVAGLLEKGAIQRSERWAEDGKTRLPSVYRVIFGRLVGPTDEPGRLADEPGGRPMDEPGGSSPASHNPEPSTKNQNTQKPSPSERGPRAGKRRIPDDFTVSDSMRSWYVEHIGSSIDGAAEHAKFLDYWRGHGKLMADWEATWRTWMRRSAERVGGYRAPGAPAAAAKPRFPTAQERAQQQRDDFRELALEAEAWVEANGGNPEDGKLVQEVMNRIKEQRAKGSAPRTPGMYSDVIDGEILTPKEVTAGENA